MEEEKEGQTDRERKGESTTPNDSSTGWLAGWLARKCFMYPTTQLLAQNTFSKEEIKHRMPARHAIRNSTRQPAQGRNHIYSTQLLRQPVRQHFGNGKVDVQSQTHALPTFKEEIRTAD